MGGSGQVLAIQVCHGASQSAPSGTAPDAGGRLSHVLRLQQCVTPLHHPAGLAEEVGSMGIRTGGKAAEGIPGLGQDI